MLQNKYFSWRRVFLGFLDDGMDLSQIEPYELLDGNKVEEDPTEEEEQTQEINMNQVAQESQIMLVAEENIPKMAEDFQLNPIATSIDIGAGDNQENPYVMLTQES